MNECSKQLRPITINRSFYYCFQIKYTMQRQTILKRMNFVCIFIGVLFGCITGKLFVEQVIHHSSILNKAQNLWQRDFKISGNRGIIYTSDMVAIASDIPSTSVIVVPLMIKNYEKCANILSSILKCDEKALLEKIQKRVSTQKLQPEGRNITDEQRKAILDANIEGVLLVQDSKRNYPYSNYLSQVLGFSGIDNQGLSGLELEYDNVLKAKSGELKISFDAKGNLLNLNQEMIHQGNGNNIVLTIDHKIQSVVEREMDNVMLRYRPKSALAIAMDPNTGAILAMSSKPDFDPNHYQEYDSEILNRNLPIWMSFEPGSTFKSVTFASALEEKCFDMYKDTYYDKGYEIVEGARIKSWRAGGHGQQTFLQVLENSSNPGFVEIGRRLGKDRLYQYVKDFGFGKKTGIDLPGESSGIMFDYDNMGPVECATVAFGQGLSVTPLQLIRAFCAIINGGTLYKPYIVSSIVHPLTQEIIVQNKPQKQGSVLSEKTSALMRIALESVVANGGGKNAYIEGYQIGGKTGTAQKAVNGVYLSNEYILSFLSGAGMNDPKIAIYVACDSPQNDIQYGGTVTAPIVRNMYEDILPYLNVSKVENQLPKKTTWLDPVMVKVNQFVGLKKEECKQDKIKFEFIGKGDKVIEQYPSAGSSIEENGKVVLVLV